MVITTLRLWPLSTWVWRFLRAAVAEGLQSSFLIVGKPACAGTVVFEEFSRELGHLGATR